MGIDRASIVIRQTNLMGRTMLGVSKRLRRTARWILIAFVLCYGTPSRGELAPDSGTFAGIYHQDRWGVGHFGDFFVSPELHERLSDFEGRRVRIEARRIVQPINPGPAFIQEITHIVAAPKSPLRMEVVARPSRLLPQCYELTVFMVNRGGNPIDINLERLTLEGSWPPERKVYKEEAQRHMGYTNKQLSVNRQSFLHGWDGDSPISSHVVIPVGRIVRIAPGQKFPIVADPIWHAGEAEYKLSLRGERGLEDAATWFRTEELEESVLQREDVRIVIDNATIVSDVGGDIDVRMTLRAQDGKKPLIVVSPREPRPVVAGKLLGTTEQGRFQRVCVPTFGTYGGPSQLQPIPAEGLSVALRLRRPLRSSYRYEVLTERGLEMAEFTVSEGEMPDTRSTRPGR
jgi:hypothetical protein